MVDFRINVVVDPSRVEQGTRRVEQRLTRVNNRADQLRRTLGLTFGALAGGALIFGAVRSIAQFEESIATARAVTKATGDEFERLRDRALELGIATRFSATQAADSLVNLARAGFSVNEAIEAVDDTLRLAQAGGLNLAQASDIAASTLRGFRLEVDQAARVTDVLVEAANSANTNVQQLGEAIKFVAPIAAGLNQSLEGTTAALGVLSDAGLKATLAGTGLRRVLAELESPSSTTEGILRQLGLTADDVQVSQVGLVTALERLREAGITTGEALEVFGQRGGPAFSVLVNNIPRVRELGAALENSAGAAKDAADIIDNTLNGALLRARSAIEGFVLALGQAGASDFLIGFLDSVAGFFRLLADNAEVLQIALVSLTTVGFIRLAQAIITRYIPSLAAALTAQVTLNTGLGVLRATYIGFVATINATIAPLAALGVAVAAVTASWQYQKQILEDIEQSYKNLEEDSRFGQLGTQIRQAEQATRLFVRAQQEAGNITAEQSRELQRLNQVALRGTAEESAAARDRLLELAQETGAFSESQIANIEKRITAIRGVRDEIRQEAEDARAVAAAQEAQGVTTDNLLAKLDRQIEGLRQLNQENEIRKQAEEEIDRLLQAGQGDAPRRREEIEARLREVQALEDQKRILESIRGPQEQFNRDQAALQALLDRNVISAEEFNAKIAELKGELTDAGVATEFENALESLTRSNEQLQLTVDQGELVAAAVQLENQLRAEGVDITRELQDEIANQLLRERELTAELQKRQEAQREAQRLAREQERQAEREQQRLENTARSISLAQQQAEAKARVNEVFQAGLVTKQEAAQALADIQLRGLEASTSLGDGFARAFAKISREAEDLAAVGEKIVNVFADKATEAIIEFVETGRFNFKQFASDILKEITRIIIRLLVVQALNAAFGGGIGTVAGAAGGLTAGGGGGRQEGGTVQPARSFVVGENGPELFVPSRTGTIVPNPADAPQQSQPVNVQVVNVSSMDDVPQAINDGNADDAIINAIQRNKDRVNQAIQ